MRAIVSAAVLTTLVSTTNGYDGPLSFKPTADPTIFTFKIMQIADIHLAGDSLQKDAETYGVLDYYIKTEISDLIVLSGDQLHGDHIDDTAVAYYDILGEFMDNHTTPWGLVFGNHDDHPFSGKGAPIVKTSKAPRAVLMETLAKHSMYGMTKQDSPDTVIGVSNYVLDVSLKEATGLQIILLDTGGGTIPEQLHSTQLEWLSTVRNKKTPGAVFQHIPTVDYNMFDVNDKCVGDKQEEVYPPGEGDAGIVNYLINDGNVMFMSTGHDHGNNYCCPVEKFSLCYGKMSGFGGYYQSVGRGVKMYEITANVAQNSITYKSWIRRDTGDWRY